MFDPITRQTSLHCELKQRYSQLKNKMDFTFI